MTLLPTIEEIQAEAKRLSDLNLIAWESITISIDPGKVTYRAYAPCHYLPIDASSLDDLESAARKVEEQFDPIERVRKTASELGFDLVEKGGAGE